MRQLKKNLAKGKNLLIVDSNVHNHTMIMDMVIKAREWINVIKANSGQEALKVLKKEAVDIILLAWDLPVMRGIEVLEILKQNKQWNTIPVIMYTESITEGQDLEEALNKGAADFIRKPVAAIEFLARIRSILYQNKRIGERIKAEKNSLEKEILLLKKEMNNYLLLLTRKNEALKTIKKSCEEGLNDGNFYVKKINIHINKGEEEDYWADFMAKFNQTDPKFLKELLDQNASLSKTEMRICSLIRFGMDNKEIMNILNISSEGIKKNRHRIRKKLGLERAKNLDIYLLSV